MLDRPEEYRRMAEVERRLWWYRALHHLVTGALAAHHVRHEARILDVGCGTGGLLMFLRERGYSGGSGLDVSFEAVRICHERGLPVQQADLRDTAQWIAPASVDAVVSNDTLYFFSAPERAGILKQFSRALTPGGLLILNVPALRAFRGIHDLSVGIDRRFARQELEELIASSGLSVQRIVYWPFLLSPIIFVRRFLQRARLRRKWPVAIRSDIELPVAPVNGALEFATRVENAWLPWKPFGSSLFAVAQKPA